MARRDRRGREALEFTRRFESAEVLAELLAIAGSPLAPDDVLQRFRAGRAEGAESSEVIPTLFPGPPRFPNPDVAQRLFQNLLGLWDVSGIPDFQLAVDSPGGGRARRKKLEPPGPPGDGGPNVGYVAVVRAWLASDRRARERLTDSFENRQDALLASLDERGLSDQGWGVLRQLAFELHAVLEHADGAAPASVPPEALEGDPASNVPVELIGLVDHAFARAEQDGTEPVPEAERDRIRTLGRRVLGALLEARARR